MESPYFSQVLQAVSETPALNSELLSAKEEFVRVAGPIYETDRSYDARINSFHNWYILDRPMGSGLTPLEAYLEANREGWDEESYKRYAELVHNIHGVFELVKRTKESTTVRDLYTQNKYTVAGTEMADHLDKGTLFNSRLFFHEGEPFFSNYLVLHPANVNKAIKHQVKLVRKKDGNIKELIFKLVLFQGRWDQYKQMEAGNIYRFEESA